MDAVNTCTPIKRPQTMHEEDYLWTNLFDGELTDHATHHAKLCSGGGKCENCCQLLGGSEHDVTEEC